MNAYKVTVAELGDLAEITVVCGSCETRMVIPVTAPIPDVCSVCNKQFDESLRTALGAFVRFYREARDSKSRVEFAIREKVQ
jgi:uncharacterized CHY-type Zn-finger protein